MTEAVKNLSKREIRTPFLLVFSSYLLLAMYSGPNVIIFFAVKIFEDVGVGTSSYLAAILTAGSRCLRRCHDPNLRCKQGLSAFLKEGFYLFPCKNIDLEYLFSPFT